MFEILDKSYDNVIALKVHGKLVHADYQKVVPMMEDIIKEHGGLRCYFEMCDFHGGTPRAMWDDFKFGVTHSKNIERCAVVGDKHSHEWMAKLGSVVFRKADMKYFDVSESDEAWQWVTEGAPCHSETACCMS